MMVSVVIFILLFGYFHINSGFALSIKKRSGPLNGASPLDRSVRLNQIIGMDDKGNDDLSQSSKRGKNLNSIFGNDVFQNSSPLRTGFSAVYQLFTHTQHFFERFVQSIISDPDLTKLIAKGFTYGFWTFVTLILLGTIGIDTKPLLSLISVLGITIGFAAKDLIKHGFAGLYILFTRPFQRGDVIMVGNFKGRVLSVDLRYVRLLSSDGKNEIMVPLSLVYGNAITIEKPEASIE